MISVCPRIPLTALESMARGEGLEFNYGTAHTCNTFENPTAVTPVERTIDFADGDALILPAASVTGVVITPIAL